MNFDDLMGELSKRRSIFHSEADFKFSLAWLAQQEQQNAQVRLEFRPSLENAAYVDIYVRHKSHIFIELKYRTASFTTEIEDEKYVLLAQEARDVGRYNFLRDVQRLELFANSRNDGVGFAIILTNDPGYWQPPGNRARSPNDLRFRIHEGNIITRMLDWQRALPENMSTQFPSFSLKGTYCARWQDYSEFPGEGNAKFRYLMFKVPSLA